MTDYTELVKALLLCAENFGCPIECPRYSPADEGVRACVSRLEKDAAAAIEDLQAEVKAKESSKQRWKRLAMDTADYVDVVRCGDCQWYNPLDKSRPFFCPVMDCVNGVMEDDYCSRGERKSKMEVQDG